MLSVNAAQVGLVIVLISSAWCVAFCQDSTPQGPDAAHVIQFLNETINWYRGPAVQKKPDSDSNDLLFAYENRQRADEVVRLAFDFARRQARLLEKQEVQGESPVSSQYEAHLELRSKLDAEIDDTKTRLNETKQRQLRTKGSALKAHQSQALQLQAALDLLKARRDALQSIVDFESSVNTNRIGANGLKTRIDAIASSLPEIFPPESGPSSNTTAIPAPTAVSLKTESPNAGLWVLMSGLFSLSAKVRIVTSSIQQTQALSKKSEAMQTVLVAQLTAFSNLGETIAPPLGGANQLTVTQESKRLESRTKEFKDISDAVVPLAKQRVLLDEYTTNLTTWRSDIRSRIKTQLTTLVIKLGIGVVAILLFVGAVELWRRIVYRYVQDPRRRYQILLVRKFAIWTVVALSILLASASQLGSVATFAGLITAGVAVSLQNVILSIVGYFFLIGKFGIRVGDRVQISTVKGEVVDVGLVRMHLMELNDGQTPGPTGRIVSFSNSIVFQGAGGVFKDMPGIHFAWHEITLALPIDADPICVKKRLRHAVDLVLADYQDEMDRQNQEIERTAITTGKDIVHAQIQFRYSTSGVEALIRYPVDSRQASEIDERVSQEVVKVLRNEPNPISTAVG